MNNIFGYAIAREGTTAETKDPGRHPSDPPYLRLYVTAEEALAEAKRRATAEGFNFYVYKVIATHFVKPPLCDVMAVDSFKYRYATPSVAPAPEPEDMNNDDVPF